MDLRLSLLLLRLVFIGTASNPRQFLVMSLTMFVQNLMFFAFWAIFLSRIQDIAGWRLPQIAVFQGVETLGVGLAYLFAYGSRWISDVVASGEMDIYVARPCSPLLQVLTLHSDPSTIGDIVFGLLLILAFGHLGAMGVAIALACALCVAVLFVAVSILFETLVFFLPPDSAAAQQLFGTVNTLANIPQHAQGLMVKVLLFSILPAGFMVILPVEAVRQQSGSLVGLLAMASAAYMLAAIWLFNRGLRRYASATGWTA
jgi:ABC-2 type transport system permease protein